MQESVLFAMIYAPAKGGSGAPVYTETLLDRLTRDGVRAGMVFTTDEAYRDDDALPYETFPIRMKRPPIFDSQPSVVDSIPFRDLSPDDSDAVREELVKSMCAIVVEGDYKLIHVQHGMYFGFAAAIARRRTGVPYVVTLHVMELNFLDEFPDPIAAFVAMCEACRIIALTEAQKQRLLTEYTSERIIELHARARGVSLEDARTALALGTETPRIDPERVIVCPLGIDMEKFSPMTPGLLESAPAAPVRPSRRKTVLFAGRLIAMKGVLDLLEAEHLYNRSGDVRTLIVGGGELGERVEAMAAKRPNVTFVGYLERELMPSLLATVSLGQAVFVVPSSSEGLSVVYLEAMACGLRVVGCASGDMGALDFMQPPFARFCDFGNPEALAVEIGEMLDTSVSREAVSRNVARYTTDRMCMLVFRVYEECEPLFSDRPVLGEA